VQPGSWVTNEEVGRGGLLEAAAHDEQRATRRQYGDYGHLRDGPSRLHGTIAPPLVGWAAAGDDANSVA